jgi:transcriptional regulator with XRE-family HTH domain
VIEPSQDIRPEDIGTRLRTVRELTGARTGDVAKSAGLSRRELQAAERGAKRLSADQLHALAGALSVDPDVLVGVGFDGELVRAGTADDRTGQVVGHGPERWDNLPNPVDDLPQPLPVNLLNADRRSDHVTRRRIEESWLDVRDGMHATLATCARLVAAGAGDDVRRLIERLECDLQVLKTSHAFQRTLADHEQALTRARRAGTDGAGETTPASSALESG